MNLQITTKRLLPLLGLGAFLALTPLQAAVITVSLGNTSSGFNPGDAPTGVDIANAQAGQVAPFDQPCGNDSFTPAQGGNCDATWTFTYANILDTINSASISIGIVDTDSASAANPVNLFTVAGFDLTSQLNTVLLNAADGDGIYNVYTLNLTGSSLLAALATSPATVHLILQGPVLTPALFGPDVTEPGNGAGLIYSSLTIDHSAFAPVPEPSTYAMFALGLSGIAALRRRK